MSINKYTTFKATFFLSCLSDCLFSYFSFSFLVIPTSLSVHTGKQDFLLYRKGFISATWRQARGGISSAIQATAGQTNHIIYYIQNRTGSINYTQSGSLVAHAAHLSQFSMSPEHDDKMLATVRAEQPPEQSCSQTNTKASHKPQSTSHFPLHFFSVRPQILYTQTEICVYRRRMYTKNFQSTVIVFTMLSNWSCLRTSHRYHRETCLLLHPSQSDLYWGRTDREPGV